MMAAKTTRRALLVVVACLALLSAALAQSEGFRRVDADAIPAEAGENGTTSASPDVLLAENSTLSAAEANATETEGGCVDEIWEDADTTCADHLEWSQCGESWMQGWCKCTCADSAATDAATDAVTDAAGTDGDSSSSASSSSAAEALFGDDSGFRSYEECERESRSLLNNFGRLLSDEDIMSCASGAGSRCCRGLNRYLGEGSTFYGCPCYGDLYNQAISRVPAFAKSSS